MITCPACRAEVPIRTAPQWTSVARVTNLAEAGFLANDLSDREIEARVFESESFSALSGGWSTTYLIQVRSDEAAIAADRIRRHLADAAEEELAGYSESLFAGDDGPVDPVFWRPVALMLIAGMASLIVGQRFAAERRPAPPPLPRTSLPATVHAIGRSFVTEPKDGVACHRLSFHPEKDYWCLETDRDGDGRFETWQRYRRNGARW
jgi:hypothetical protein